MNGIDGMAELMPPMYQICYLLIVLIEFILFGSKDQRQKLLSFSCQYILGTRLYPAHIVKNLAMLFNADFSFSFIQKTCKACFLKMSDLGRIRQYLTHEVTVFAANAFVSSHLEYCNFLFRS